MASQPPTPAQLRRPHTRSAKHPEHTHLTSAFFYGDRVKMEAWWASGTVAQALNDPSKAPALMRAAAAGVARRPVETGLEGWNRLLSAGGDRVDPAVWLEAWSTCLPWALHAHRQGYALWCSVPGPYPGPSQPFLARILQHPHGVPARMSKAPPAPPDETTRAGLIELIEGQTNPERLEQQSNEALTRLLSVIVQTMGQPESAAWGNPWPRWCERLLAAGAAAQPVFDQHALALPPQHVGVVLLLARAQGRHPVRLTPRHLHRLMSRPEGLAVARAVWERGGPWFTTDQADQTPTLLAVWSQLERQTPTRLGPWVETLVEAARRHGQAPPLAWLDEAWKKFSDTLHACHLKHRINDAQTPSPPQVVANTIEAMVALAQPLDLTRSLPNTGSVLLQQAVADGWLQTQAIADPRAIAAVVPPAPALVEAAASRLPGGLGGLLACLPRHETVRAWWWHLMRQPEGVVEGWRTWVERAPALHRLSLHLLVGHVSHLSQMHEGDGLNDDAVWAASRGQGWRQAADLDPSLLSPPEATELLLQAIGLGRPEVVALLLDKGAGADPQAAWDAYATSVEKETVSGKFAGLAMPALKKARTDRVLHALLNTPMGEAEIAGRGAGYDRARAGQRQQRLGSLWAPSPNPRPRARM